VIFESATAPAPGTKLVSEGNKAGEVTSAVYSPALGRAVGLAYVRSETLEKNAPMTIEGSDPPVAVYSSPSTLP
jgi:glycine cleavage system aminomethyltransferase T